MSSKLVFQFGSDMSQPSECDPEIVRLNTRATLRDVMSIQVKDDARLVVQNPDGPIVILTGRALRELIGMLHSAPNWMLAEAILDAPLGALLAKNLSLKLTLAPANDGARKGQ
jgi:hypothetical protein